MSWWSDSQTEVSVLWGRNWRLSQQAGGFIVVLEGKTACVPVAPQWKQAAATAAAVAVALWALIGHCPGQSSITETTPRKHTFKSTQLHHIRQRLNSTPKQWWLCSPFNPENIVAAPFPPSPFYTLFLLFLGSHIVKDCFLWEQEVAIAGRRLAFPSRYEFQS